MSDNPTANAERDTKAARTAGVSRRRFLGTIGASAAGLATLGVGSARAGDTAGTTGNTNPNGDGRGQNDQRGEDRGQANPQNFGRMFRLPSFAEPSAGLIAALIELGRPGGLLDANDPLDRSPKDLIVDLSLSANNPNNPSHTAGTTFLGQFLDHDLTFDANSRLGVPT